MGTIHPTGRAILNVTSEPLGDRVVAVNGSFKWTHDELTAYFSAVADPTNWKKAVDATLRFENDRDLLGTRESVIFFTGSVPTITVEKFRHGRVVYRVRAAGYYQTIGA
jgi:hypothetical protein